jgi:hypothetical protein
MSRSPLARRAPAEPEPTLEELVSAASIACDVAARALGEALGARRAALVNLQRARRHPNALVNKLFGAAALEGALGAAGIAAHLAMHVSPPRRRSFEAQARILIAPEQQPREGEE